MPLQEIILKRTLILRGKILRKELYQKEIILKATLFRLDKTLHKELSQKGIILKAGKILPEKDHHKELTIKEETQLQKLRRAIHQEVTIEDHNSF
jgi:hypothetical protein